MARARFTGSDFDPQMLNRANAKIAQGALTNSKRPESFVKGFYPTHLQSGRGVHVVSSSNKRYIEFICGLGTNLLGYANASVTAGVLQALTSGPTLSLSTTKEIELAELISDLFPVCERVKFLKSGTEGCLAAIKIARAASGRTLLLSEGYHGWSDEFVSLSPPALGVPPHQYIKTLPTNLDEIPSDAGAVIVEPIVTELSDIRIAWLQKLRDVCTAKGIPLIFDETITALRFPKFSVANFLGIQPDITVFGKALANGFPISCVGGRASIMNGEYFVSSTFAGETVSIAAAIAVLKALHKGYDVNHLWTAGTRFKQKFNALDGKVKIDGYPTRGVLSGDDMAKALFMQEACRAGLLFGPSWFYAFPHIELEDQVIAVLKDVFMKLSSTDVKLEGEMPRKPFAQKVREEKAA